MGMSVTFDPLVQVMVGITFNLIVSHRGRGDNPFSLVGEQTKCLPPKGDG